MPFFLHVFIYLSFSSLAIAQQQPAGVVTAVQGQAQLTRAAAQNPLRFKDGVILRDVVDTREKSLVRILFGGKSTVTVRELSRFEVREETLATGATRSTIEFSSGAILVNVARQLMKPGDEVIIRTPNAVAAVRGSVIFAAFNAVLNQGFFAQITGSTLVTPEGQTPFNLLANTQNNGANVSGRGPGVQANVINVPPAQVNQILRESQVRRAVTAENRGQIAQAEGEQIGAVIDAAIDAVIELPPKPVVIDKPVIVPEVVLKADLDVTKSDSPDPVTVGSTLTYTVTVKNKGPNPATGVTLTDSLPSGVNFVSATSTQGSCSQSGGTVTCNLGTISNGATSTVTVTVTVTPTAPATITETASVSSTVSDPDPSNNTATAQTTVTTPPPPPTFPLAPPATVVVANDSLNTGTSSLFNLPSGQTVVQNQPLLIATNANINIGGNGFDNSGNFTSTSPDALFQLDPTTLTVAGDLFLVNAGGSLTTSGGLLSDVGGTITVGGSFLNVNGGTVTSTGAAPFIQLSGSTVSIESDFIQIGSGGSLSLAGAVLSVTGGTLTVSGAGSDLVSVSGGTINLGGPVLSMPSGTPLVSIDGDVLNIASTVTGPSSGSLFSVGAGELHAGGDVVDLAPGSTLNLSGPVATVSGGQVIAANILNLGAPLTTPNSQPALQVNSGQLSATNSLAAMGANFTLGGAFLSQSGGAVSAGADALAVGANTLTSGTDPVFNLTGGTLTVFNPGSDLVSVSGGNINLGGPLVNMPSGTPTVSIGGDALNIASTVTGPPSGAIFSVAAGELSADGNLVNLAAGSNLNLSGPVATVSGGTVIVGNALNLGAPLTTPAGQPLLQVSSGQLSATSSLATLGANLTLGGSFLSQSGGAVSAGADALAVGSNTLTSGTDPVFNLTGGTLTINRLMTASTGSTVNLGSSLLSGSSGATITGTSAGPFIEFTNSTVSVGTDLAALNGGSLNTAGPFLKVSGGSLTLGATSLLNLSGGASVTAGGSLLDLTNLNLDLGSDPVVRIVGGSTLTNTAGPVIKITGGSLTADVLGLGDGTETYNFTGTLLDLANTTVTLRTFGEDVPDCSCDNAHFTLAANEPLLKLTSSTLKLTDNTDHAIGFGTGTGSPVSQHGVLLISTGTAENPSKIEVTGGDFFGLRNVNLIDTIPQIQLTHTMVTQTGLGDFIVVNNPPVTVAGSLLKATDSSISTGGNLLFVGGSLTGPPGPGAPPLIQLDPTTITTGADLIGISFGGSLSLAGPLITDSGGTFNITGSFLRVVDGSTFTSTTADTAIQLSGSTVATGSQVIALSSLTAQLPPSMTLAGPLLSATNNTSIIASNPDPGAETFLFVGDSATLTGPPKPLAGDAPALISFDNSSLEATGSFLSIRRSLTPPETPSTLELGGPLLTATGGSTFTVNNFVSVNESGQLIGHGTTPLIQSDSSEFNTAGNLFVFSNSSNAVNPGTPGPSTVNLAGALLSDTDSTFNITNGLLRVVNGSTFTSTTGDAAIQLSGSTVNTGSNVIELSGAGGSSITLSGPILSATNETSIAAIEPTGSSRNMLFVVDGATLTGPAKPDVGDAPALFTFDNSTFESTGGFVGARRSSSPATPTTIELGGPLLVATNNSAFAADGNIFLGLSESAQFIGHGTTALVQSNAAAFTTASTFLNLNDASGAGTPNPGTPGPVTMNLTGAFLNDTGSTFDIGSRFVSVAGGSTLTSTSTDPFIKFNESTVSTGSDFARVTGAGSMITLAGPLLSDPGSTFDIGSRLLNVASGSTFTSTSTSPLIQFNNSEETQSTVNTASNFFSASGSPPATVNLSGSLLSATNTDFTAGDPSLNRNSFLFVSNSATVSTSAVDPFVTFDTSTLNTAGNFLTIVNSGATPSTVALGGPLLQATGSSFTTFSTFGVAPGSNCCSFLFLAEKGKLESTGTTPLLLTDSSSFDVGSDLVSLTNLNTFSPGTAAPSTMTLAGPLLSDIGSTFDITSRFVRVGGGSSLAGNSGDPFIQFSGSTVDTGSQFVRVDGGGEINLAGPFVEAANTTFNVGPPSGRSDFIDVRNSDSLFKSTGLDPLVTLNPSEVTSRRFLNVVDSGAMELAGPALKDTGGNFTTASDFAAVHGLGSFVGSGTTALFQFENSNLTVGTDVTQTRNFLRVNEFGFSGEILGPATMTLEGSLLTDIGSTFNIAERFLLVGGGSSLRSTTTDPFIQGDTTTATVGQDFVRVSDSGQLITGGSLLRGENHSSLTINDGAFIRAFSNALVLIPGAGVEGSEDSSVTVNNSLVSTQTIFDVPVRRTNKGYISLGPNTGLENIILGGTSVITADGAGTLVTIDPLMLPDGPFLTVNSNLDAGSDNLARFEIGTPPTPEPITPKTNEAAIVTAKQDPESGLGQGIAQLKGPVIKISDSTVTSETDFVVVSGTSLAIPGPLLDIKNSTLDSSCGGECGGSLLRVESGSIVKTFGTEPLIKINPSTIDTGSADFIVIEGILALSGPLLTDSGSTFHTESDFLDIDEATLVSSSLNPLIQLSGSTVNVGEDFFDTDSGSTISLAGPFLKNTGSTFNIDDDFFDIDDVSLTTSSPDPLVQLSGSTVNTGDDFLDIDDSIISLAGPLLIANSGATFDIDDNFLTMDQSSFTSTSSEPLIQLTGVEVTTGSDFVRIREDSTMDLQGPLLNDSGSIFNIGGTFLRVVDDSTFKSASSEPLIQLDNSKVTVGQDFVRVMAGFSFGGATMELQGPLLKATDSEIVVTGDFESEFSGDFLRVNNDSTLSSTSPEPLIQLSGTAVAVGTSSGDGDFIAISNNSSIDLEGALLQNAGSTYEIAGRFLRVAGGSTLTSTNSGPFIQLSGSTVDTGNDFLFLSDTGSKITLSGSFLSAGSTLNIGTDPTLFGDLLDIRDGAQLVMNSSNPVVLFTGGTHTVGTDDATANNTANSLFRLSGVNTDGTTGLGTDQPIKGTNLPFDGANNPIGVLLKATDGATIEVKKGTGDTAGGNAVRFDTMLYEATAGILELIGSATKETTLKTAESAIDIFKSKIVSLGPVVSLDKSFINVTNGAFIILRDGTEWKVTGDLLKLINGAKIEVINGPLIEVRGTSSTGTQSLLDVSQALVNFGPGGSGNSKIIVNNTLCGGACVTKGGSGVQAIQVKEGTAGSITIGSNPIKNSSLGSIQYQGSNTALIQTGATGKVNITAAP